jgi:hypothetical protein
MGEGGTKLKNVQTTAVLPGGSTIVEFTVDVPGKFLLVDHALSRMNLGQLFETILGSIAKNKGQRFSVPVFEQLKEEFIINELKSAGLPFDGKVKLYDGQTVTEQRAQLDPACLESLVVLKETYLKKHGLNQNNNIYKSNN